MNKPDSILENGEAAVDLDNERWQMRLRKCPGLGDCQFPASTEIEIGGTLEKATITMKEKGLHANMQSDGAAFEAWALALLFPCRARKVRIGLDAGASAKDPDGKTAHYERFLYRLRRFSELFPGRVEVDWPAEGPRALAGPEKKLLLNQPNSRENPPEAEFAERMLAASANVPTESDLEKALEISDAFKKRFHLDKVMRQWPVGLFEGCVTREAEHQIFTGGKSAIDLIGKQGDTLVLFELKKARNRKAGAVSELLFYASVMRDAIGANPKFHFDERKSAAKNCAITPKDIIQSSSIRGVLLAPDLHPLISAPFMFEQLNAAMKERYAADRSVHFETAFIKQRPQHGCGDFEFSDDLSSK